jgi:hypothetical protein
VDQAFDVLLKTGALQPRMLPPSPSLLSARDTILRLWERWDEKEAARVTADNLFLDTSAETFHKTIEELKSQLGPCETAGEVEPENLLRGKFQIPCTRGRAEVFFTLAPTMPPSIQRLRFSRALYLSSAARKTVDVLTGLVGNLREEALAGIAGSNLLKEDLGKQLQALHLGYGSCRVGKTLAGDGEKDFRVRLDCDRGPLDVSLSLEAGGRIQKVSFNRSADSVCVP